MPLEKFQFQSIDQLVDGAVALAINQALRAAFHDCSDRPEVKKPRKVTLDISYTPEMVRGEFSTCDVALEVKQSVPSKGVVIVMKALNDGLGFQPGIADNPNQKPLPFTEENEA